MRTFLESHNNSNGSFENHQNISFDSQFFQDTFCWSPPPPPHTIMDMRNNKRRVSTHARVNFSQSETVRFCVGGWVKFWASTVGGGGISRKDPVFIFPEKLNYFKQLLVSPRYSLSCRFFLISQTCHNFLKWKKHISETFGNKLLLEELAF